MSKLKIIIFSVIGILLLGIIATLFFINSSPSAILYIEEGEVSFDSGNGWQTARDEMELKKNYKIKTHPESTALILLFDKNILRMEENTEISLEELSNEKISIRQKSGSIWNRILLLTGNQVYEVKTPSTIASVRGTGFLIEISEKEKIIVGEGIVNVKSTVTGEIKEVTENEKVVLIDGFIEEMPILENELEKISKNLEKDIYILKELTQGLDQDFKDLGEEISKSFELDVEKIKNDFPSIIGGIFNCEETIEDLERDRCYSMLAVSTQDIEICENIRNNAEKESCYMALISISGDSGLCSKVSLELDRNLCYSIVAITTQDPEICKKIVGQQEKEDCYMSLAFATYNIEICKEIQNIEKRNDCENFLVMIS